MATRLHDPGGDEGRSPWISLRDVAVVSALVLAVGGVAFWRLGHSGDCAAGKLVNPGIACNRETLVTAEMYDRLEADLSAYLEGRRAAGKLAHAAVHARSLRDGPTLSIDEYETFAPASLLKLPVVLGFFRFREDDPSLFETQILYDEAGVTHYTIPEQTETPHSELRRGERHSIEALLRATLVHSDNLAYYLLLEHANYVVPDGQTRLSRTFQELGVVDPTAFESETLSAHGYGRIFRLLYNASYLGVRDSEQVLSWLAESPYDKGLAAGVPATIAVGNKFGERLLSDGSKQLHDCGIVFLPEHPYSLCVMTQGREFSDLEAVIRDVSRMVFDATAGERAAKERHAARTVRGPRG